MSTDSTVVLTDINAALQTAEKEAGNKPAALLVVGGELNGTLFDLVQEKVTIGRAPKNTIPLEFQGISRHHMSLYVSESTVFVEDAGSKNGTYLNNKKIEGRVELKRGDIIKMGCMALKYIPRGDPERLTYDKLNMEANTDGLTKCFNKTYFSNILSLQVKKSKVTGDPLSLVVMDLDHFKKLNDNYGHDAGDYVLKEMANKVRNEGVRDQDVFARYGGEEFVVLLPNTNLKFGFEIAERIRKVIETHKFIYDGKRLPVTASIGVADYRKGVNNGTDLFRRADAAVYQSKSSGRNKVSFYKE